MHLTRYYMYRQIGAVIGHQLRGKILGISGIENFERWIDRPNSRLVDVWYPLVDMQKLPFETEEFDVVVSDLDLGDGSGLELMRHVRSLGDTPGIALSGYATEEDVRQSLEAGFAVHAVVDASTSSVAVSFGTSMEFKRA